MTPTEILQKHNVQTAGEEHHHVSHGWLGVDCPNCSPNSSRFRLGFEIASGRCNCWHCGLQNPVAMMAAVCRIDYQVAKKLLGDWSHRGTTSVRPRGTYKSPAGIQPLQPAHRRYIASRGFDVDDIVRLWGVRGIGIDARLGWRLWIPIRDARGDEVSWTTRAIGGTGRRYISATATDEAISHKSLLYGADLARHAVVVVEGPLDAWAIGPGAVATCGVGYTAAQLDALLAYPRIAVCFDSSSDAQRRAADLCNHLAPLTNVVNVHLSSGDDPADVLKNGDRGEIDEIRYLVFGEKAHEK